VEVDDECSRLDVVVNKVFDLAAAFDFRLSAKVALMGISRPEIRPVLTADIPERKIGSFRVLNGFDVESDSGDRCDGFSQLQLV
jgi:hypothetical protein